MSSGDKYFLGSESMDHQLSNALSTMFLRHLVMFLHFETYALANPQKAWFSPKSGPQLDFLPHIYMRQEAKVGDDFGHHPGFWVFLNICLILFDTCVGYQYQRSGMSFGVKPIYS